MVYWMNLDSDYQPGVIQAGQQWMVIVSADSYCSYVLLCIGGAMVCEVLISLDEYFRSRSLDM